MLSIVVYGRNDSHGYNLHKRAALSFNCLAHVLDDDDDEIVFVDYNTPPEMPTFVEAIHDTLTDEAIRRLRIIRVPASIHADRFADRTHLVALEPVARNVGVRRTSPANRWVLSTNTDMLFVPTQNRSLSDIVGNLDDGYYALPRFSLPEPLWEALDRKDPAQTLERAADWGTSLHLDEVVTSYPWLVFDAPGDFQLVLRDRLFEMHGFDEEMLLGWHVDSNFCKRHWLGYGEPSDLRHELRGYHCDHTRVPGVFHSPERVSNDLERFMHAVDRPDLPEQADTWGLADVTLEEVDLRTSVAVALPEALRTVLPEPASEPPTVDGRAAYALFCYPAEHVLPFVASALAVVYRSQTVAYVGENIELVGPLARLLSELGFSTPLLVAKPTLDAFDGIPGVTVTDMADISLRAEAVIFDFGLPASRAGRAEPTAVSHWPYSQRRALGKVMTRLDELTLVDTGETSDARPLRAYIVVNAIYNVLESHVDARVATAAFQFSTRVRHGYAVRPPLAAEAEALELRWAIGYGASEVEGHHYELGTDIDLTGPGCEHLLEGDWSWPEPSGRWTEGRRAVAILDVERRQIERSADFVLSAFVVDAHVPAGSDALLVDMVVNGSVLDQWRFDTENKVARWKHALVTREVLREEQPARLELVVQEPSSPFADGTGPDPRDLGLKIRTLSLAPAPHGLALGERLATSAPAAPSPLLWQGWSFPEPNGTWTDATAAVIRVPPFDAPSAEAVELILDFSEVNFSGPNLHRRVEVSVDGDPALCWWFTRPLPQYRSLPLPVSTDWTTIVLSLPWAISPHELGMGDETRRLGLKLSALRVLELIPQVHTAVKEARSRRLRPRGILHR